MTLDERVQAGLAGKYQGLNNGLGPDINRYIYNFQTGLYVLYGGLSGAAKTTLVDFIIQNAKEDATTKGRSFKCFYYSYEIRKEVKKLNWLSVHIYRKYGVIISPETIGGMGDLRMSPEEQKLVEAETPHIEDLFENHITFRFEAQNPTGIFHELWEYAKANGTFLKETYKDHEGKQKERITGYIPNDPAQVVSVVLDHMANCKRERDYTLKENIDKLSEYAIILRNLCGYRFDFVQQFNQSLNSVDRMKLKGVDLSPQQNDFKDSTNPYTDADLVIGVMNPWKMDFKEYLGHDLTILKEKFRLVKLIKSRLGRDNVSFAFAFKGEAGSFKPLPKPETFQMELDRYENYL